MIPVDAILFDLDGTLVDSKRDLAESVRYLQKHYKSRLSSQAEVAAYIGDGVRKLVQRSLPEVPEPRLNEAVEVFKKFYRHHCVQHTRPYPTVRKTLQKFREKPMAVVTNKPVRISAYILDQLELSLYFKVLIGGDSLPNKKPHPEPILNALKTMRIRDLKRVVIVGDSPNDILSGKAAGILTCGIKSNIGDPSKLTLSRPDFRVTRLSELTRFFE